MTAHTAVHLGDLPTWLTAAGTLALFAVTVATLIAQRKELAALRVQQSAAGMIFTSGPNEIVLRNNGPGIARDITLEMLTPEDGRGVPRTSMGVAMPLAALLPGQDFRVECRVYVGGTATLMVRLSWSDDNGSHEHVGPVDVTPTRPPL